MNKILNFGSLNIDIVYSLDHIVRPGETLSSGCVNNFPGGKGLNQSVALSRSGATVYHAGKIGTDGELLKDILLSNNIVCDYLKKSDGKNGHAIIQVEKSGQNSILLFTGTNHEIDIPMIDEVLKNFDEGDFLVCQNEISNMDYILKKASELRLRIALNPSPIDEKILSCDLSGIEFLIINEIEGSDFTGETDADLICENLLEKYPNMKIVLTIGKRGVIYRDKKNKYTHGIFNVKVVDTTAAGDTFLGYFIGLIAAEKNVELALKYASAASSIAVSRTGAVPSIPTIDEVETFLKQ
ncbi:MAG: ribokinase [Oscillospiraceae bacterium]